MNTNNTLAMTIAVVCLAAKIPTEAALGCPLCPAVGKTFGEEIATVDVAVVARLAGDAPTEGEGGAGIPRFEIVEVIKGAHLLGDVRTVETMFAADAPQRGRFLLTAAGSDDLLWSTALPLSARALTYLKTLLELPPEGPQRLKFVQQYFEDDDPRLAQDACDEFSRLPYSAIRGHGPHMDHDRLIELIRDDDVAAARRRVYLTMLSVCGTQDDVPLLEALLESDDANQRRGLDALIVCYLVLAGERGMPLVERRFLANASADHAETYAAIMAYRFLGAEQTKIPRRRLLEGFRPLLDRPELADLVIPDFARWEDWSVIDKLVVLFKNSDEKTTWVRVPVVNYLRRCPRPRAARVLDELEQLDPESVRRARTFFPDVKQGD